MPSTNARACELLSRWVEEPMTKSILVPLDGSPESEAILPEVMRILPVGETVHLLHVVPAFSAPVGFEPKNLLALHEQALTYLEGVRRRMMSEYRGLEIVRWGDPATEILHLTLLENVHMVAMSTRGRGNIARTLLGSVAAEVVRKTQLPALLTHPGIARRTHAIRRVLVPIEGLVVPHDLLETVKSLGIGSKPEIILFHAVAPVYDATPQWAPSHTFSIRSLPKHRLQDLADTVETEGNVAWASVGSGEPVEAILAQSRERGVDLIALTTHGRKGLERLLEGSVAEGVLRGSTVPVLLQKPLVVHQSALLGESYG
jgi:nucleotide-binding universal stress UspA family protein